MWNANFVKLMRTLLKSGIFHGIATHDEAMIAATRQFVREEGIDPGSFEFQMLYGVRRDLQRALVKEGLRRAGLHSLRSGVVSLLHAAAGGAAGQCIVPGPQPGATLGQSERERPAASIILCVLSVGVTRPEFENASVYTKRICHEWIDEIF